MRKVILISLLSLGLLSACMAPVIPSLPPVPSPTKTAKTVTDVLGDVIDAADVSIPDVWDWANLPPLFEVDEILGFDLSPQSAAILSTLGFSVQRREQHKNLGIEVWRIKAPAGALIGQVLAALQNSDKNARYARNAIYRLSANNRSCSGNRCYGQDLIGWSGQSCGQPRVGMIDSGLALDNPALAGQKISTRRRQGHVSALDDHGTAIAALLVGHPDSNFPGLLPHARLYAADVFSPDGQGGTYTDVTAIIDALDWLVGQKVDAINMSLTGPHQPLLQTAIERVNEAGIMVLAAAGNLGPQAPAQYPAAYPNVVAVTAVDRHSRVYRQANQGNYVDVAAPGVGIWSTGREGTGLFREGTSMAVPFVTAVAAQRLNNSHYAPRQIKAELLHKARDLGDRGKDRAFGWGLLQASACAS